MTRPQKSLLALAILSALCLGWLFGHFLTGPSVAVAPVVVPLAQSSTDSANLKTDVNTTVLYAHNIALQQGPAFRIYIRWIRGQMLPVRPKSIPSFDDPDSFVLEIQKGVLHANIGDLAHFLNANTPSDAPFTKMTIEPDGEFLKIRGTAHRLLPLPVELVVQISATAGDRVKFHVTSLKVLKLPMKGLFGAFHLQLSDLVHSTKVPGIDVSGDDIIFNTQLLVPPPHIHGQITSVRVNPPDVEVIYGGSRNDEAHLAQWHNFMKLTGGTIDFGKLTMHDADLTMIDASDDPWFDLDLVHYQAQLVNGFSRLTPQAGLEIFMPDLDEKHPHQSGQTITLDWLRNKKRALPPDVPIK